jgi:hypothetical protein
MATTINPIRRQLNVQPWQRGQRVAESRLLLVSITDEDLRAGFLQTKTTEQSQRRSIEKALSTQIGIELHRP